MNRLMVVWYGPELMVVHSERRLLDKVSIKLALGHIVNGIYMADRSYFLQLFCGGM